MPDPCELVDISKAFHRFAFPPGSTQTSQHIKHLHWYVACRLVVEGGFDPDCIEPRPPFSFVREGDKAVLHHEPTKGGWGERTVYGGLKTKNVDVSVSLDGIGPVLAISLKGTHNAFRNLTNRMEEAAGDCTNLHLAYPALVYGFWHVLRANEEHDPAPDAHFKVATDGRYLPADVSVTSEEKLSPDVLRLALALERLSDRDDLRDSPSRYEACALTLVRASQPSPGTVHAVSPAPGTTLEFNRMFSRLYELYDRRFVYQAPALVSRTARNVWSPESPVISNTILGGAFAEMVPRVAPSSE